MVKLPRDVSGREVVRAFEKIGYYVDHQKGSHIILKNVDRRLPRLSVPAHKTIRVGLLKKLIRDAGLAVGDFAKLLK